MWFVSLNFKYHRYCKLFINRLLDSSSCFWVNELWKVWRQMENPTNSGRVIYTFSLRLFIFSQTIKLGLHSLKQLCNRSLICTPFLHWPVFFSLTITSGLYGFYHDSFIELVFLLWILRVINNKNLIFNKNY